MRLTEEQEDEICSQLDTARIPTYYVMMLLNELGAVRYENEKFKESLRNIRQLAIEAHSIGTSFSHSLNLGRCWAIVDATLEETSNGNTHQDR